LDTAAAIEDWIDGIEVEVKVLELELELELAGSGTTVAVVFMMIADWEEVGALPLAMGTISVTVMVWKEFSVTVTVVNFSPAWVVAAALGELEAVAGPDEAAEVTAADG
jgi:hypothetical protein